MGKKLHYILDNGGEAMTVDSIDAALSVIKTDHDTVISDYGPEDHPDMIPFWKISPVWMTEEEYKNLYEA